MRILVTGANGQLGMELANLIQDFPTFTFYFKPKSSLNIVEAQAVEKFVLEHQITAIINCAAYTKVDEAEDEIEAANAINFLAVKGLAEIAKKHQIKLVHISTDYVFDGNNEQPYLESQITNPQNTYGKSKRAGENAMLEVNPENSVIIRTSWLYSSYGANFVKKILKLTTEKEQISVVSDQIGSPTYAADLAKAILLILPKISNKKVEIYHYANKGNCSWFQFAKEIATLTYSSCEIKPIASVAFLTKAKRPAFSILNTNKIEKEFGLEIFSWQVSLKSCLTKLEEEQ